MKSVRRSASVMLVNLRFHELLMARRSAKASFMPNAVVFPGGVVQKEDATGTDSEEGSLKAQGNREDMANRKAALRELFEECGLLPLVSDQSKERFVLSSESSKVLREWQQKLNSGEASMSQMLETQMQGFRLDVKEMKPLSNWLTPFDYPKRFDNYLYTLSVHESITAKACAQEISETRWETPEEILREADNGRLVLPPPQAYELKRISDCKLERLEKLTDTTKICPQMVDVGKRMLLLLNGDQAYVNGDASTMQPMRKLLPEDVQIDPSKRLHRISFRKSPLWSDMKIYA